jgi:hypothetical protein
MKPEKKRKKNMTIEKATLILADWLNTGTIDMSSQRVCEQVYGLMAAAVAQGEAWNWTAAEKHLHKAYQVLGALPIGSGYDWHKGCHPIQIAATAESPSDQIGRSSNQIKIPARP